VNRDFVARQQRERARVAGVVALMLAVAVLAGCTTSGSPGGRAASALSPTSSTDAPSTTAATTTTTTDPGTLSQTREEPVASGATFDTGVNELWEAVVNDDPRSAAPFFFPLSAYLQVKAISDPADDWQNRLVAAYGRDIHSLHRSLGANAAQAQLVGIDVPQSQAEWITPGVEYNKIGYWRVYGTRIRYTVDGRAQSFAVVSLISWRGEWYVVHLSSIS
jgi:hypothetical protein